MIKKTKTIKSNTQYEGNTIEDTKLVIDSSCRTSKFERTRKRLSLEVEEAPNSKYTCSTIGRASQTIDKTEEICFICNQPADGGEKNQQHNVRTLTLGTRAGKFANVLQDERLILKFRADDLEAQEARYHISCLLSLLKTASNAALKVKEITAIIS